MANKPTTQATTQATTQKTTTKKTTKTAITPTTKSFTKRLIRILGVLLFSSVFVYYGYKLYALEQHKTDTTRRLTKLLTLVQSTLPQVAPITAFALKHINCILIGIMELLFSAPVMLKCNYHA